MNTHVHKHVLLNRWSCEEYPTAIDHHPASSVIKVKYARKYSIANVKQEEVNVTETHRCGAITVLRRQGFPV